MEHTKTNEQLLHEIMHEADATRKDELISDLFTQNERLWLFSLRKYQAFSHHEYMDLYSCVQLGFLKAVQNYDPEKCTRFTTFVIYIIQNEIKMEFRRNKRHYNVGSLNEPLPTGSHEEGATYLDILEAKGDNTAHSMEDRVLIREALIYAKKHLSPKEWITLQNAMEPQPLTASELGRIMGHSQSYVSRLLASAQRKLRNFAYNSDINVQNWYTKGRGA